MVKKIKGSKGVNPCFFFLSKIEKFEIVIFSMLCVDKVFGDVLNRIQSTLEEKNVHL